MKRKGKLRKIVGLLVLFLMIQMLYPICSFAAEATEIGENLLVEELMQVSQKVTNETIVQDTVFPVARSTDIVEGAIKLVKVSSSQVAVWGRTTSIRDVDLIKVSLTLEKYVNGNWTAIKTWPYAINNDWYITLERNYNVASGYYYRLRGEHTTVKGSRKEKLYTLTEALYVN